ncbi:4-hydroxy-tetrahydrodipicolinate synthase [Parapedobacter koreensis]|uniref:4-hydroxy-tetrahydrodipicolinate synthase n=1 Tax=Parapedobacter koreensis TaxID=332977 RepID=A0A1H7IIJ8_9SPHI|nr:4-hydroxy-tetrahydrodipicolinate synthase [Parapedobacter koreensis]SEK61577.1 4-hydroxy-tetrahydrodipicolinate synthase [Parapedobacter koreensis]
MDELYGAGVALVTPFHSDGTIDYPGLEKLIEHQISGGMDYLVSLGTTGEAATLTADERKAVWKFTATKAAGRIPLVAGIGGNNTAEVARQLETFDHEGYTAILSVSPYYNKPTQEGIYQHYKAIVAASPLPLILYNVPGRTGSQISPETTVRLANEFGRIVGTKEASGSFDQFSKIMRDKPDGFLLISGDDPVTLPMIALGAAGIISVIGNAFPAAVARLAKLCLENQYAEARKIHNQLIRITELCFAEGNPAGVKAILEELGICGAAVRLPLVGASDRLKEAIRAELAKTGTL